jgi:hypothetical protein
MDADYNNGAEDWQNQIARVSASQPVSISVNQHAGFPTN